MAADSRAFWPTAQKTGKIKKNFCFLAGNGIPAGLRPIFVVSPRNNEKMRVFKDGDINCVMMDTDNGIFIRVWTSPGISVETNEKIAQNIKFLK